MTSDNDLRSFHRCLKQATKILCVVGSGISATSGIPTFQAMKGNWRGYTSLDLATPEAFHANPGLVWTFYSARRYTALKAKPNKGHYALAELCKRLEEDPNKDILVVSLNMDGLHQRAGQTEDNLVELHGSLFQYRCTEFACTYTGKNNKDLFLTTALREITPRERPLKPHANHLSNPTCQSASEKREKINADGVKLDARIEDGTSSSDFDQLPQLDPEKHLPLCPKCRKGLLRPGVVWYGESLPLFQVLKVDSFVSTGGKVDLVLVIGTSGKAWPAMGYVEEVKKNGGRVAIFNTSIPDIGEIRKDKRTWAFEGDAVKWLPKTLEPIIGKHYIPRDHFKR